MYNGWLGSYPLFFYITPTRPPLPSPQLIKHKSQQYYAIHSIKKKKKYTPTCMILSIKNPDFKINTKKLLLNTI